MENKKQKICFNSTKSDCNAPVLSAKARTGVALLVVLFIIMAITVLTVGYLTRSDVELKAGENVELKADLDYLAESGLEHAKGLLLNPEGVTGVTGFPDNWTVTGQQLLSGNDYYDVNVIYTDTGDANSYYLVTSTAYRESGGSRVAQSKISARVVPLNTLAPVKYWKLDESDGNVSKVEFYQGSTLLYTDTTSPYSYTWTDVPVGRYGLTAKATDNFGAATISAAVNITVNAAAAPAPTYQAAGLVVNGQGRQTVAWPTHQFGDIGLLLVETANQAATLSTPAGFVEVTGSPQGTGTAGGSAATRLTVFWKRATSSSDTDATIADAGDHIVGQIITFRGCIESGNPWDITAGDVAATASTSVSIPGAVTTDANTLVVAIVSNGTDTSTEQASGWMNANLTSLIERIDNGGFAGNGGGFAVATGVKATAGAYVATTATLDTSSCQGRMSIALKSASVNVPPTVSITSPANGATFTTPTNVTINATATDSDGTITSVEFYQGATLLGTDTTSPYSYAWTSVPAGSYSLTAKATDNLGAVTTSAAVGITVDPAGNATPIVLITSPADGATFTAPASVTINAIAAVSSSTTVINSADANNPGSWQGCYAAGLTRNSGISGTASDRAATFLSTGPVGDVVLYENANYAINAASPYQNAAFFSTGSYLLAAIVAAGVANDAASAITFSTSGFTATLYKNDNFLGTTAVRTANDNTFAGDLWLDGTSLNDNLSSMIVTFTGTPAYIRDNAATASLTSGSATVSFWMCMPETYTANAPIAVISTASYDYQVGVNSSAQLEVSRVSSGPIITTLAGPSTTAVNDNRWHHVACILDCNDSKVKLYIDGNLEAANGSAYSDNFAETYFYLGYRNQSPSAWYAGRVDEVLVYNKPLNQLQINYLASQGPGSSCTSSVMHVDAIDCNNFFAGINSSNYYYEARAIVTVYDACGRYVKDATVTGDFDFGGGVSENGKTAVTDTMGRAVLITTTPRTNILKYPTFTVTNVTRSGWTYSPGG